MPHQNPPCERVSAIRHRPPALGWREGDVPVSETFHDPYYSCESGIAESRHVFLAANRLPERFRPGFHIAELGLGTGLNMLVAWQAFRAACPEGTLGYSAFELYPMRRAQMARALGAFPELAAEAAMFLEVWTEAGGRFDLPGLALEVIAGDAREMLPRWEGRADAWFLDGFAPARNPELWGAELMAEVARHTAPGGSFATYSAAGAVRRALGDAGFRVARLKGYGRKRHMSAGWLDGG